MAPLSPQFYIVLVLLNALLQLSNAQLTGTLRHSSNDPEILTVSIVNSGNTDLSVSNRNNVFDTRGLAKAFSITDESGNDIPIAYTQSLYLNTGKPTLLDLPAGKEFKRQFNLTDYVDLDPEVQPYTKHIIVSLASIVRGIEHSSQTARTSTTEEVGTKHAQLSDITIKSEPLKLTWTVHGQPHQSETRQFNPTRGLRMIPGKCEGPDYETMKTAMLDAGYLAGAALIAAASFGNIPFKYFFGSDPATANKVADVFTRIQQAQSGNLDLIGTTCEDVYNNCGDAHPDPNNVVPAYTAQLKGSGRAPIIVFCRVGLALKRNPVPCTANPGTISLGWLMVHSMTNIYHIQGPGLDIQDKGGDTARQIGNEVQQGVDTTINAKPYAYLGSWAWDMGLGGEPWNQQKVCLNNFWRGNFDTTLAPWVWHDVVG